MIDENYDHGASAANDVNLSRPLEGDSNPSTECLEASQ